MIRHILNYTIKIPPLYFVRSSKSCMERLYAQTQTFSQGRIPSQSIRKPSLGALGCGLVGSVFYKIYSAPPVRAEEAKCLSEKVIWTLADGAKYEGDVLGGQLHGQGVLTFANGTQYKGDFLNDQITGKGSLILTKGDRYEGDFLNGLWHGKGIYTFASGNQYKGDFFNNQRNGKGIFKFVNGDRYEGDFFNDQRHGQGSFIFANGDRCEGDFLNGVLHGKGSFIFANGDQYKGDFFNNQRNGKGIFKFVNGVQYEGDFFNDERSGQGILLFANGDQYEGNFLNDQQYGQGVLSLSKKNILEDPCLLKGVFHGGALVDLDPLPDNIHILSIPKNQTRGVILKTMYDHNQTFNAPLSEKILSQRLEETGHPVTKMQIGSAKDLLEHATNTDIGLLWVQAHGGGDYMVLGENFSVKISDLKPVLDNLNKDAIVVLHSCNTGNPKMPCIAQDISNYLCSFGGNPLVVAPSEIAMGIFSFTPIQTTPDAHQFHIGFYNTEGKNITRFFQCPSNGYL